MSPVTVTITDDALRDIAQKLRCAERSILRRMLRLRVKGQRLSNEIDAELAARGLVALQSTSASASAA